MSDYKHRRGSINVTFEIMENSIGKFEGLFSLFQKIGFLPLHIETNYCTSVITYMGCAKEFDVVPEGNALTEYKVIAEYDPVSEQSIFEVVAND